MLEEVDLAMVLVEVLSVGWLVLVVGGGGGDVWFDCVFGIVMGKGVGSDSSIATRL